MKRKNKGILFTSVLLFLLGLCIATYPNVNGFFLDKTIATRAHEFLDLHATDISTEEPESSLPAEDEITERKYPDLWAAASAYNDRLFREEQVNFNGREAYQTPGFILADYGLDSEIFAVIRIPAIDVEMPIYLGATYEHLTMGAAHLGETSLPIGGADTNCVIAGHRGWKGGTFFRHLEDLQDGDTVYIDNLWETLTYTVVGTEIIEPNQIDRLLIRDGKDLVTLFTCTKNGKQRLVVYCERTA